MKRVKIADLKNNLSRHLALVRSGGDLLVLDRETPVARIIPFDRREVGEHPPSGRADDYWTPERLAQLEQSGAIARRGIKKMGAWAKTAAPVTLPAGTPSAVGLLVQVRRESQR